MSVPTALPSQRELFDIPPDVCYLNAGFVTPIPRCVRAAGEAGVAAKAAPWHLTRASFYTDVEAAREAAAGLIGAEAQDIAIVGATSYGIATAGANLALAPGQVVLVMEGEHASQTYEWIRLAEATGGELEILPRPADDDWTAAFLRRLADAVAPPVAIVAATNVHWVLGSALDLEAIGAAARARGAALVVDGTQSIGVRPFDVRRVDPDFLVFATYKWLLGPYGLAFLYAAPRRQHGRPLEQHAFSRAGADQAVNRYDFGLEFMPGARRYDMGERANFVTIPMAVAALRQVQAWGVPAIAARLRGLTTRAADAALAIGLETVPASLRSDNILGLRFPGGFPSGLVEHLAAGNIHVSARNDVLRVAPHVYNDEADIDRLIEAIRRFLARG